MQPDQKDEFQNRLKRISKGGANTMGQVYVGVTDGSKKGVSKKRVSRVKVTKIKQFSMFAWVLAMFFGAVAMLGGRLTAFHGLIGDPFGVVAKAGEAGPLLQDWGYLLVAGVLAYLFMTLLRQRGQGRRIALMFGMVAMNIGEPMLTKQAPEVFAYLYSPALIQDAMAVDMTMLSSSLGAVTDDG